jgi:hypothetical protein
MSCGFCLPQHCTISEWILSIPNRDRAKDAAFSDDVRQLLLLKVIRACMESTCSFISQYLREKEDGVTTSPTDCAFCDAHKQEWFPWRHVCCLETGRMHQVVREKGMEYISMGKTLQDKPTDRGKPSVPD